MVASRRMAPGQVTLKRGVETTFPADACARPPAAELSSRREHVETVFAGMDTHKDSLAVAVIDPTVGCWERVSCPTPRPDSAGW